MMTLDTLRRSWQAWYAADLRRSGPWWLQPVWTFLLCLAIAAAFTLVGALAYADGLSAWTNLAGWAHWYELNLIVSLAVGYTIHALFELGRLWPGRERIRRLQGWRRAAYFAGIPFLGTAIGWPLGLGLLGRSIDRWFSPGQMRIVIGMALFSLLVTAVVYRLFHLRARQLEAERRATAAQLQLLQGQIEPHFLFNTLANVLSLIEVDTPKAKRMLETFVDYLRASLSTFRGDSSGRVHRLGDELTLVEAYLQLLQVRMGARLAYRIQVPEGLRTLPLPALTLQPLVENAVQHGLEPKIAGGTVTISAAARDGVLSLEVSDDGLGTAAPAAGGRPGTGVALDNVRARLRALYGDDASLDLQRGAGGARACLQLPWASSDGRVDAPPDCTLAATH